MLIGLRMNTLSSLTSIRMMQFDSDLLRAIFVKILVPVSISLFKFLVAKNLPIHPKQTYSMTKALGCDQA